MLAVSAGAIAPWEPTLEECLLPFAARAARSIDSPILSIAEPKCQVGSPARGGSHPIAPPAAPLRCRVKPPPRQSSWEWGIISAKLRKTTCQSSLWGFSPWGSLLKKILFFQRGRTRLSLSTGALEIVSRWALEKRGSPGCESLWKPLSELFVAASLIFHATRY